MRGFNWHLNFNIIRIHKITWFFNWFKILVLLNSNRILFVSSLNHFCLINIIICSCSIAQRVVSTYCKYINISAPMRDVLSTYLLSSFTNSCLTFPIIKKICKGSNEWSLCTSKWTSNNKESSLLTSNWVLLADSYQVCLSARVTGYNCFRCVTILLGAFINSITQCTGTWLAITTILADVYKRRTNTIL